MWKGQSRGSLATMTIGTGPPLFRFPGLEDEQVGVVGEDAQEDGVDDTVDVQLVKMFPGMRVRHQRISHEDVARLAVIAAQDHEVPRRHPADVIRFKLGAELAHISIQERGAQSCQDWYATQQKPADQ